MAIKLQARQIPQNPGVYFFKSASRRKRGKTLYIGKASNLRARLSSYLRAFRTSPAAGKESLKLSSLLKESDKIEWEILNSEVEALIKEAELIKKYRPKYNVLMRDDKNYFYVAFTKEKFPKIFLTHQPTENRNPKTEIRNKSQISNSKLSNFMLRASNFEYIGPFTEGASLKSVLKTLRRAFPYCTCKSPHKRPCLNARLGKCLGYCCLNDSGKPTEQYQKNISAIKKVLSGKNQKLARELTLEMKQLSKSKKYEEAGKTRDRIRALERIFLHRGVLKQDLPSESLKALRALESILNIEKITRIEAYDIANIGGKFAYGSMTVWENGEIKKDDYRIFKIKGVQDSNDPAMLREVLSRRFKHPEWNYPQVIIVDGGKPQMNAMINTLRLAIPPPCNTTPPPLLIKEGTLGKAPPLYKGRVGRGMGLGEVKLIALTKNKKHVGDHIFMSGRGNPLPLDRLPSPLKNLILHLDSEAHRFAIKYYRNLHRKNIYSTA